ncbi:hypothetical protein BJ508DRAFT_303426 [Ascobolus immersus RN42]|uniref:HTH La-type RNA-binding domain-containing protein n=1 Tax=Ascobolus immersus RN42 TaxID=1160509 RepID=A0A3N4IEU0_ASCIM|nr:hypothetical protein BJ508DRAFT_303426 [Ascobolus immersus RN42]
MSMPTSTTNSPKPESRFSYAAAASGKQKTTVAPSTMAPAPVDSSTEASNAAASGSSNDTQVEQSVEITRSTVTKEAAEPAVAPSSLNGTVAKEEKEGPVSEEKHSEAPSGRPEEAPKPKELVPAKEPAVNVWTQRQEQAAKAKVNVVPVPAAAASPAVSDAVTDTSAIPAKPAKDTDGTKKKASKSASPNNWDHTKVNGSEKADKRERKKADSTKEKATNGPSREATDAKSRTGRPSKAQAEVPTVDLKDDQHWPAVGSNTSEAPRKNEAPKKKEDREESLEKPATGSKTKAEWARLPLDLGTAIYSSAIPKRGGSGSRGGRGGGGHGSRGGHKQSADGAGAGGSDNERGRTSQGDKPSRGGYTGGRGGKRAASAGNGPSRKGNHGQNSESRKEEAETVASGHVENSTPTPSGKPNAEKTIPQSSPKAHHEKSERQQAFGAAPLLPGNPDVNPNPMQQRNSSNGRGGYKGRGNNHYNTTPNGHQQSGSLAGSSQQFAGGYQPRNGYTATRGQRAPNASFPRYNQMQIPTTYPMSSYPAQYDLGNGAATMSAPIAEQSFDVNFIKRKLVEQVEYYFCIDNLCKDVFLRSYMDSEGFVKLAFLANFTRVRALTQSYEVLRDALLSSNVLEVATSQNGDGVRRKGDWEKWVRPLAERHDDVKGTPGPWTVLAERPIVDVHHSYQPAPQVMNGYVNGYHADHSVPQAAVNGFTNGNWYPPPQAQNQLPQVEKLSATVPSFTPKTQKVVKQSSQPDVFPDSALADLVIVLVPAVSGATAHGFLQGDAPATTYHPITDTDADFAASSAIPRDDSKLGWIEPNPQEGTTVPIPEGATHRPYLTFKEEALKSGSEANKIPLYRFWRHFLLCHYNRSTYIQFRKLALELPRSRVAFEYFLTFLKYAHLSRQQPPLLVTNDFVDIANSDAQALTVLQAVCHDAALSDATKAQILARCDDATRAKLQFR